MLVQHPVTKRHHTVILNFFFFFFFFCQLMTHPRWFGLKRSNVMESPRSSHVASKKKSSGQGYNSMLEYIT